MFFFVFYFLLCYIFRKNRSTKDGEGRGGEGVGSIFGVPYTGRLAEGEVT